MDVITRLAAFLIALLLAIDAYSGERNETLRVGGHSRALRWHRDDVYRLHFTGRADDDPRDARGGWFGW
jgi:hypothetical protein